jgi:phosphoglycerate dehydrogenase-like enzyme
MPDSDSINVIVAMNIAEDLVNSLREVSPRLRIERYPTNVPDRAWENVEILYTGGAFPKPEQAPRLRWIQLHSAGVNHALRQPIIQSRDIEVTTLSGIHAVPMSEFSIAMMLAFTYQLPKVLRLQAKVEWIPDRDTEFRPVPLRGQTLGIVGYGNIGRELARAAAALGMTVLATKRDVMHPADEEGFRVPGTGDPEGDVPARLYPPQAIGSMAKECDFLVVTAPLTDDTRHMIDANVLKQMKKTAVIINVARGAVIDEAALTEALQAKKIGGAALDVFEVEPLPADSPLWKMDNVIVSSHIAGNFSTYDETSMDLFKENLKRYLENVPLINLVHRERGY